VTFDQFIVMYGMVAAVTAALALLVMEKDMPATDPVMRVLSGVGAVCVGLLWPLVWAGATLHLLVTHRR